MKREALSDRLWLFAARVGKVVDALPDTEGCAAESKADFCHKLSIALKELRETYGWLKFIPIEELLPKKRVTLHLDECDQPSRIIGKSVSTAKGKSRRPPPDSPDS